jgi:putative ABC transport system permease protein
MLDTILAGLRYRKARLLLSSLAIALGVMFVAGTLLLTGSTSAQYYASFAAGAKNVSALVAAPAPGVPSGATVAPPGQFGAHTVPFPVLGTVRDIPGVADAAGRVIGWRRPPRRSASASR